MDLAQNIQTLGHCNLTDVQAVPERVLQGAGVISELRVRHLRHELLNVGQFAHEVLRG